MGAYPNFRGAANMLQVLKRPANSLTEEHTVAHTIVTNTCEGIADCVEACPVACIHEGPGKNAKGTNWFWIDFATCIDCGICLQVCPVAGAIVPEERPDLQATP